MNPVALEIYRHKIQDVRNSEQLIAASVLAELQPEASGLREPLDFLAWCAACNVSPMPALATTVAAYALHCHAVTKPFDDILIELDQIAALHSRALWAANPVATSIVSAVLDKIAPADAIKPPRSWRKDEAIEFELLPRGVQAAIARRQSDHDSEIRRLHSEWAAEKKRLQDAAKEREPEAA